MSSLLYILISQTISYLYYPYDDRASYLNMKPGGGNVVYKTRNYSSCQSLNNIQVSIVSGVLLLYL